MIKNKIFQKHRSKINLTVYLILLVISLAFIIAGLAVYSQSIGYTISNVDNINVTIHGVGNG